MKIISYWTQSLVFNDDTPFSTHSHLDFPPSSEVATMWQTDSAAHKLKPRLFHKSAHLQVHSVDFHPGVNRAWQYYQTPKSAVASEQFCLLNPLSQFCLQSILFHTSKSKWPPLTVILQLRSHCLRHLSTRSCVSVTRWLIRQMHHNAQDESINEAVHLRDLPLVQSNLPRQFCLSLAQVLSLWIMILIGRMPPLLIRILI